jgi:hypothetical protein
MENNLNEELIRISNSKIKLKEQFEKSLKNSVKLNKFQIKLLKPHEKKLLKSNEIFNVTHKKSTSVILERLITLELDEEFTTVYRPMGDKELFYLLENNILPDTQPYQTIVEGPIGREYCDKYLTGKKYVDSLPTTIVEFIVKKKLIEKLFKIQSKIEDGCLSIGKIKN